MQPNVLNDLAKAKRRRTEKNIEVNKEIKELTKSINKRFGETNNELPDTNKCKKQKRSTGNKQTQGK